MRLALNLTRVSSVEAVMNGANLSAFWDAAPTGQELILPQTQGGVDACPGLWEVAPSGLKLVPFEAAMHFWRAILYDIILSENDLEKIGEKRGLSVPRAEAGFGP
jgi:hypothetical protein